MSTQDESLQEALGAAFAAYEAGDLAAAERTCREVLGSAPRQRDALQLLGVMLAQAGRLPEAEAILRQAVEVDPGAAYMHFNLGHVLSQQGRRDEALASYTMAAAHAPDFIPAAVHRCVLLTQLGRLDEALAGFDAILANAPETEAFYHRGNVLRRLGRTTDAVADYDAAISGEPTFVEAHNNKGNALRELRKPGDALACYDRALAVAPRYAEALVNRGNALRDLRRMDEALASYDRALALRADDVDALVNRGVVLREMNRPPEACASFDRALAIAPGNPEAHWNKSLCLLLMGDFEAGWREYEWRWALAQSKDAGRDFAQPAWLGGESITGKTVLLHAEQGLGDTLQFCRFARLIAEQGARVALEVQPPLKSLLARLDGPAMVVGRGEPLPPFDVHCPLMSLPLALGTRLDTIPTTPYIASDPERVRRWDRLLGAKGRPRIGIAWSGNAETANVFPRSIPFAALADLLSCDAQFVSLQKDIRPADREAFARHGNILHFAADFDDTAALIELVDLVVTVDTSIAHLAGAMGKPTWILLPYHADWIWLLDRDDTPWYPTARLFRSPGIEDWSAVLARVKTELAAFLDSRRTS